MVQILSSFSHLKAEIKEPIVKKIAYLLACGVISHDPCWAEANGMVMKVRDFVRSLSSEEIFTLNGILSHMQCGIDDEKRLYRCGRGEYDRMEDVPTSILANDGYQELLSFAKKSHTGSYDFWKNCQIELGRIIETYSDVLGAAIVSDLSPIAHTDAYRAHIHDAIVNLLNEAREKIPI